MTAASPPTIELDVATFLGTGTLGTIRIGDSMNLLRETLPPAVDDGIDLPPGSAIWAYGTLELHFVDDRLALIWCDRLPDLRRSTTVDNIRVDPWIICEDKSRTLAEMLPEFAHQGWTLRLADPSHRYSLTVHIIDSGVELHFEESPTANDDAPPSWPEFELVAFALRSPSEPPG
ncbi:hypothetical protein [Stackebrandtia soli]|uniref:hypothetical protein n=1 Tax=Stackebrandtia soli TaxID=1892856 RepID=UPI0039ED3370